MWITLLLTLARADDAYCAGFLENVWPALHGEAPVNTVLALRGMRGVPLPDLRLVDDAGGEVPIAVELHEEFDYFSLLVTPQVLLAPNSHYQAISSHSIFEQAEGDPGLDDVTFTYADFVTSDAVDDDPPPGGADRFDQRVVGGGSRDGVLFSFDEPDAEVAWYEVEVTQPLDERVATFPVAVGRLLVGRDRCMTSMHVRDGVDMQARVRTHDGAGHAGPWVSLAPVSTGCATAPGPGALMLLALAAMRLRRGA